MHSYTSKTLGLKPLKSHYIRRLSLLLTLILSFALDSCNNNDNLLIVGYYIVTLSYPFRQLKLYSIDYNIVHSGDL